MSRSNNSNNSISGATMASKSKPKKFCTRGEEFFDLLKALGYQPSKHQQHEHFEYLFQDDKSASFVRKLSSTLKTDNCLSPEEIQRYEELREQKLVMYGSNLEEAVSRRRAINEMYSQQKLKRITKKNELKKIVEEQEAEVQKLAKLRDEVFMREVDDLQTKKNKVMCSLDIIQRLTSEYEKEIDIDLKLLNEKMEDLEETVVQLKKNSKPDRNKDDTLYLCQINVKAVLEKEERLVEEIQEMITKHGTELIMKDAGYAVEGDPLNDESIRKIFSQYEKDFDRLKHCIVYERVNQAALELSLAGEQGCLDNLDECTLKAAHLAPLDFDTKAKLQMETRASVNDISIAYERESDELFERVREATTAAVNQQFSAITNIKARAKKKLQEFFTLTTNVLKAQKLRVSLIRNLIKSEGKIYGRLVSNIEENIAASTAHSKKLASNSSAITGLNQEGQSVKFFMTLFGIQNPYEIISSLPKVHLIVSRCHNEIDNSYWSSMEEERSHSQSLKKHLSKTHEVLKNILQSANESSKSVLMDKEEHLKQEKQALKKLQQTRAGLAKEQQKSRVQANQKLKDILGA